MAVVGALVLVGWKKYGFEWYMYEKKLFLHRKPTPFGMSWVGGFADILKGVYWRFVAVILKLRNFQFSKPRKVAVNVLWMCIITVSEPYGQFAYSAWTSSCLLWFGKGIAKASKWAWRANKDSTLFCCVLFRRELRSGKNKRILQWKERTLTKYSWFWS